jgi:L-threonylcarbamoyladenylate synthase
VLRDGNDASAMELAATRLAAGDLVAFPTETVYGLGARADQDEAVAKIFAAKGRPADHPLIVHVAEPDDANAFASDMPVVAARLIKAFWPGPLTVIVPRAPGMATAAAASQSSVGLRCPSHPVAQRLLKAARARGVLGVAAPSANLFGRVSPTRAQHVVESFDDALLVLDGGACQAGIESSIVDCSRGATVLLRPGVLPRAQIEAVAGQALLDPDADAPRASGTLEAHYAPRAKLRVMSTATLRTALEVLAEPIAGLAVYSRSLPLPTVSGIAHQRMPARPDAAAHELFAVMRELDAQGARLIWVEEPPPDSSWDGVRDRLMRAAAA